MQQDVHTLVQLISTAMPNIPNRSPILRIYKIIAQSLPTVHIFVSLLVITQIPIFSPIKWDYHMHPTLLGPIMATHLKIKEFPSCA